MRRKTLAILTFISLGFVLVTLVASTIVTAATAVYCSSPNPNGCPPPTLPPSAPPLALLLVSGIGEVLMVAAGVLQIITWIGALIKQAKQQQWAWFVCTLLFSPLCLWIYLLAVPEAPTTPNLVSTQRAQPIYQPYAQGYRASQSVHEPSWVPQQERPQFQDLEQQQQQYTEDLIVTYPEE